MPFDGWMKPDTGRERINNPCRHEVLEVLQAAKAKIEKGWCRGAPWHATKDGFGYCVIGAIECALSDSPLKMTRLPNRLRDRAHNTFREANSIPRSVLVQRPDQDITSWNDHPLRKREQVIEAFDKAIEWEMKNAF
jgi:hypothetical protein